MPPVVNEGHTVGVLKAFADPGVNVGILSRSCQDISSRICWVHSVAHGFWLFG